MAATLHGQRQRFQLWKAQHGRCPICNQPITEESDWHIHQIIWRCHGGTDSTDNLMLLHPECHRSVHARVTEEPPRPAAGRLGGLSGMP